MPKINWSQHWMLIFVPIAMYVEHTTASDPVKFLIAALAIVPVARLIGHSTENLAHYTGDSVGALLNAMFGNLPELIICIVALKAGLYSMVAASLIGAILFAAFDAYQVRLQQISGGVVPYQVFLMMPYALSILALILVARRATYPKALMIPYQKGER